MPTFKCRLIVLGLLASLSQGLLAGPDAVLTVSDNRLAAPKLQVFSPSEYGAHPQNWDLLQIDDGTMLIANQHGILQFDGSRFESIWTGSGRTVTRLHPMSDGRIFAVGDTKVGELVRDEAGTLAYVQRVNADRLPEQSIRNSLVWQDQLWLQSGGYLLCWCDESLEIMASGSAADFLGILTLDDRLVVTSRSEGWLGWDGDQLQPLESLSDLAVDPRAVTFGLADGHEGLLSADEQGWLVHSGTFVPGQGPEISPLPAHGSWAEALDLLRGNRFFSAETLADGRVAIGTVRAGLFVFDAQGRLDTLVDQVNGLPLDTVVGQHEDREGGLWLATLAGIARAEIQRPLRLFDERHNLRNLVHSVHRVDGQLWAATATGIWRLSGRRFEAHPALPTQTWDIGQLGAPLEPEGVLAGTDDGVYLVQGEESERILDARSSYALARHGPGHWLIGHGRGLWSLCPRTDGQLDRRYSEINETVRSIEVLEDGTVWLGTMAGSAWRVRGLDPDCSEASTPEFVRLGADEGMGESNYVEVYQLGGRLRFGTRFGIRVLDDSGERVVPDQEFESRLHDGSIGWYRTGEDPQGRIHVQLLTDDARWGEILERDEQGVFRRLMEPLRRLESSSSEGYLFEQDGFWMHDSRGLKFSRVEADVSPYEVLEPPRIRVLAGGRMINLTGESLAREDSSLTFRYAWPRFDFSEGVRWRSRLQGFDDAWSDWSALTFRDFTNLPGGSYRFQVQARDGFGRESPPAELAFEVEAVWYMRPLAVTGWVALLLLVLLATAGLARKRLAARNQMLEALIDERTEEIRAQAKRLHTMAYEDALTGLPNRRAMYFSLDGALERACENQQPLSLLAIDLNEFKQINDRFGHAAGDAVLQAVGQLIAGACRAGDEVFRPGGDEFVMLVEGAGSAVARGRGEELLQALTGLELDEVASGLQASICVGVGSSTRPSSWEEVLEMADQALYKAKRGPERIALISD